MCLRNGCLCLVSNMRVYRGWLDLSSKQCACRLYKTRITQQISIFVPRHGSNLERAHRRVSNGLWLFCQGKRYFVLNVAKQFHLLYSTSQLKFIFMVSGCICVRREVPEASVMRRRQESSWRVLANNRSAMHKSRI